MIACASAAAVAWSLASRVSQTSANVFDGIDNTLVIVRDRVVGAQQHVLESKIKTEDVGQSLRDWTREEASERLVSRLEVEEKTRELAQMLKQADLWLETSASSIQAVQQALDLGNSLGVPVEAAMVDTLLTKLADLRTQLQESTETVDTISERAAQFDADNKEERREQVANLVLRVVATLSELDSRLGESAAELDQTRSEVRNLKARALSYLVVARIVVLILIGWMAAGQISLGWYGWNGYRQA